MFVNPAGVERLGRKSRIAVYLIGAVPFVLLTVVLAVQAVSNLGGDPWVACAFLTGAVGAGSGAWGFLQLSYSAFLEGRRDMMPSFWPWLTVWGALVLLMGGTSLRALLGGESRNAMVGAGVTGFLLLPALVVGIVSLKAGRDARRRRRRQPLRGSVPPGGRPAPRTQQTETPQPQRAWGPLGR
ncbi:hypothetical protein [Streptomyces sp. ODS28]|uniref:hypothetical protein n=1 Tax=Streptomyces sp. ODS28 TaxID=3136688 RepID=UPI0031E909CD